LIAVLAVALGAVSQGVTGIGFSLVCAPILIAVLGPREGVRTALVLSTVLNTALLLRTHRHVLVREGSLLLVPAVGSTPLLAWASRRIDGRWLTLSAGALTVVSAAALASGWRWARAARSSLAGVIAGVVSAAMNVVGSIGGPAAALYSVNAGWPPSRARPTLQVVFLASNLVAIASLGFPHRWRPELFLATTAGLGLGALLSRRVPEAAARSATLGVAALGGVVAVVRALGQG
jgi:uncharacterized membrane protein YfcA